MKTGTIFIIVLALLVFGSVLVQAAPKISTSPTSIDFGYVDFGSLPEKTVTIRNKGTSDLVISSVTFSGDSDNASDFRQTNNCATIPEGGDPCTITVTFAPTSLRRRKAVIDILSNDPKKSTVQVKLSGIVNAAEFPIAVTKDRPDKTEVREMSFSAAFDGENYLVGIRGDAISDTSVTAQRVSRSGQPVGSRISTGASGGAPAVAFHGTNYLLVWSQNAPDPGLFGRFISKYGDLVGDPFKVGTGTDIKTYKILFDGTNYFVVWDNYTTPDVSDTSDVYGQFVTPSGGLLGDPIAVSTAPYGQKAPALGFDGTNILVTWADGRSQSACSGTQCYESDIWGQFITKAGTPSGGNFPISTSSLPIDNSMSVAFDPDVGGKGENKRYFVVFAEAMTFTDKCPSNGCKWNIFGKFVTTIGVLVGEEIKIAAATSNPVEIDRSKNRLLPVVIFVPSIDITKVPPKDASYYLITWTHGFGTKSATVRGRFFDRSGSSLSPVFLLDSEAVIGNNSGIPPKSVAWAAIPLFDDTNSNYFWVINRGIPGKDPQGFDSYTDVDVYGAVGPGPPKPPPKPPEK